MWNSATSLLLSALLSTFMAAEDRPCKGSPQVVEPCYQTRGRLQVTNGTPGLRMWRVGTTRMLGIVPSEDPIIPDQVAKLVFPNDRVFGDFLVCPFTKEKPGHMQMVCIESATNMRIESFP